MIRLRKYVIRRVAKCIEQDLAQLHFFSWYFLHNVFTATKNTTYITSGLEVDIVGNLLVAKVAHQNSKGLRLIFRSIKYTLYQLK